MQNLGMKHIVAQFVPWFVLPEHKEHCAILANDLIQNATKEQDYLKKSITRDESVGLWL